MNEEDVLENVVGKQVLGAAVSLEYGLITLCFEEGKTLHIKGKEMSLELEAAN